MHTEEEKQFIILRAQFSSELEDVWKRLEELEDEQQRLEERRDILEAMLGEVEEEPDVDADDLEIDDLTYRFVLNNQGVKRREIVEHLRGQGYSRNTIDKSIKRSKERRLITHQGAGRATAWYAIE